MTQKWTVPALSGIAIVFSLAWFLWARTPNEPQAGAATPVPPPSQMGRTPFAMPKARRS